MASLTVELTNIMKENLTVPSHQSYWGSVIISCIENRCLLTCDDFVVSCFQIPFQDVEKIICEDFNNHDCFVILRSSKHGCCVYGLKEKKMLDHCENATDCFIDDYVNIGHDQVVFMFDDGQGENDFYVTDYKCCLFDTREENIATLEENTMAENDTNSNSESIPPLGDKTDGYNSVIASLNSKILSTTRLLHDEIAKKHEKEELIKTTIKRLVCQSLDIECDYDDRPNLVSLLNDDDSGFPIDRGRKKPADIPFLIHEIWHKIYHEQIIICVEAENQSADNLYNVSLRLIAHNTNVSSSSEILFFTDFTEKANSPKQQKLNVPPKNCMYPTKQCTLSASTIYRDSKSGFVEFELVINFSKANQKNYSVYVGRRRITTRDLISDSFLVAEEFSERDAKSNVAYNFVNFKENFVLSSDISSVLSLPKTVSKELNCKMMTVGNMSLLKPVNLNAEIRFINSPSLCDCTVYAKKREVVKMIVAEIKKALPADVQCKMKFNVLKVLVKEFYQLLKKEIGASIRYVENWLSMMEQESEQDQLLIVIDSPKRKRNIDVSNKETLYQEYVDSVQKTDEFCIANQIVL